MLEDAREAVKSAELAAVNHRIDMATYGDTAILEAPPSVADARRAVERAEEGVTAAQSAVEILVGRLDEVEKELVTADARIARCVQAVIAAAPEVYAVVASIAGLQAELVKKGDLLSLLLKSGFSGIDKVQVGHNIEAGPVARALLLMPNWRNDWTAVARPADPGTMYRWQAAIAALSTDAGAELPRT